MANKTFPRWPSIHKIAIDNGTHALTYQEYKGMKFHCSTLDKSKRNTTAALANPELDPNRFTYNGTHKYSVKRPGSENERDVDAKLYILTLPSVNSRQYYYGMHNDINTPLALVIKSMDETKEKITVEFDSFAPKVAASVSVKTFDIAAAAAGCDDAKTGDYVSPPDIYSALTGAYIMPDDPDWGRKLTADDKAERQLRKELIVTQMAEADRTPKLTQSFDELLAATTTRNLTEPVLNATEQAKHDESAKNASDAINQQFDIGSARRRSTLSKKDYYTPEQLYAEVLSVKKPHGGAVQVIIQLLTHNSSLKARLLSKTLENP
jgi:hypothetical protein